jgi:predicted nucleic acid binding AN1-type Zn finger protein
MPCQLCKKKCGVPIECKHCSGNFCPRCLHLEKHGCSGLEKKVEKDLATLEEKTSYQCNPRCLKI